MRRAAIEDVHRPPRTSIPTSDSLICPYLLRGLRIDLANRVWAGNLTYLPMAQGFLYLMEILDVASRNVLPFIVPNTVSVDALQKVITGYAAPKIMNTDQGSQYSSAAWTDVIKTEDTSISMDGSGRGIDKVFIDRLWHSVK